ncbi:hypothetical protein G9A89_003806 [Geosiphon pyriformis]|nr:hypothetical protein G9A89_003806 [Geosiphon pyriformis]
MLADHIRILAIFFFNPDEFRFVGGFISELWEKFKFYRIWLIRIGIVVTPCLLLYFNYYQSENKLYASPPFIQSKYKESPTIKLEWARRQYAVRKAFKHGWRSYVRDAWGHDEYHPISRRGSNFTREGGIGYLIVDSLDTMLIMNLHKEYQQARHWIKTELRFDVNANVSLFETTIRILGGLLSAYHLSGNDTIYLDKARDLGDRLLGAFTAPTHIPYASVNLKYRRGIEGHFFGGASSTSEATTLQLEFKYLSQLTGDEKYWRHVENIMFHFDNLEKLDGLVPIFISPKSGNFMGEQITLGARGDSYYEYLLKQYIQTAGTEPIYRRMYDEAIQGVKKRLIALSYPKGLWYIGELPHYSSNKIYPKMDHLVCFMAGNLALGVTQGTKLKDFNKLTTRFQQDLTLGIKLLETCAEMYFTTATGLAPEIAHFETDPKAKNDLIIKPNDAHNLLRPETVESLFVLWRITGDIQYREWGWRIFQSFEKYAKLDDAGYTSLDDVTIIPPKRRDKMETFWLAETLKYLYLLFDDSNSNLLPLDQYVFNTEAHPLPIFEPSSKVYGEGWSRS